MVRRSRWKEEQNHCETHHESRGEANANITIESSPVFSSQEDGWDKHTSNAPDTPHIYQRLLISEHILWTLTLQVQRPMAFSCPRPINLRNPETDVSWMDLWRRAHVSNNLTETAGRTRIVVGSVFSLRGVQNKSNSEGDLKQSATMATLQEQELWCQKRLVHTWRESASDEPESRYATSLFPTFALRFFSRAVKEKVQRMHLVFLKPGIWQWPQVAINNSRGNQEKITSKNKL